MKPIAFQVEVGWEQEKGLTGKTIYEVWCYDCCKGRYFVGMSTKDKEIYTSKLNCAKCGKKLGGNGKEEAWNNQA